MPKNRTNISLSYKNSNFNACTRLKSQEYAYNVSFTIKNVMLRIFTYNKITFNAFTRLEDSNLHKILVCYFRMQRIRPSIIIRVILMHVLGLKVRNMHLILVCC